MLGKWVYSTVHLKPSIYHLRPLEGAVPHIWNPIIDLMTSLINTLCNSWTCRTASRQTSVRHIFSMSGEIWAHLSPHFWLVAYGARLHGEQIKGYQRNPVGVRQLIVRPWCETEALLLPADKVAPLRSAEPLHLCTRPLGKKKRREGLWLHQYLLGE